MRWRGPAAVVALSVFTLVLVLRATSVAAVLAAPDQRAALGATGLLLPGAGELVLTLIAGLLVASCFVSPALSRRSGLARWGLVLVALVLVSGLVGLVVAVVTLAPEALLWTASAALAGLGVPLLVAWGLLALLRTARTGHVVEPVVAAPAEPEPEPDPEQQPTWTTDTAAGAVWHTAGDAARGAPASGWGSSDAAGWRRADDTDPQADPEGPRALS